MHYLDRWVEINKESMRQCVPHTKILLVDGGQFHRLLLSLLWILLYAFSVP